MSQEQKLSIKEKIGYGLGDTASNLYFQMFINFLLFFYTDVFGIPAAVAGSLFVVSRVWDAVNDPIMGIIADRTETKWGKFRPYLIWMMLPLAVVGVALFTTPDLSMQGKIIYAYVTYIAMMMAYTAINIPYSALLGVLSPHSKQRTSASTYRFVLAFVGAFIIQGATLPLVHTLGTQDEGYSFSENKLEIQELKGTRASKFIINVSDGENDISHELLVKINRTDAPPPTIKHLLENKVLEKGFKTSSIDISDLFKEKGLSYELSNSNKNIVNANIIDQQIQIEEKGLGESNIKVTAINDDYKKSEVNFSVNVIEPGNKIPILVKPIPDMTFNITDKKKTINIAEYFIDQDGDQLKYSSLSKAQGVTSAKVLDNNLELEFRETGFADIVLLANDSKGGIAKDTFNVKIVSDKNDPPAVYATLDNLVLNQGFGKHVIDISQSFVDFEGDKLNISVKKVDVAKGFQFTLVIYGILACLLFYITFSTTNERVKPDKSKGTSLRNDLKDLLGNKPWMILLVMSLFTLGYVSIRMSSIMYYFKYYVQNELLASLFMVLGTVAVILGVACTDFLSKRLGKKKLYLIVMGLSTILTAVFYYIPKDQIIIIFAVHMLISFVMAPQAPLLWAMYADTADYSQWKNGRRATGLVFSAATFSQKFGMALGGGLAGWLLTVFHFIPNVAQTTETLNGIKLMMSYIPAIGTLIATLAALFYPLDDDTMEKIEADLKAREES
jgi:Na+/melibiose symporter-like transporter